ncbi:regulatory protein, luxR family [Candidatus Electrothrix marina]|uniref:Regulatory protein, luxR family n=1 Tax=Candidatus Electrothrix marina TaxID=1859130 RepID=A0A444JF41_9BACT|nr:regulatory protein, luxR family [Candidatus Electrothrix marina]
MVTSRTDVLIVDDDEGTRLTIKHIVESAGYQARTAAGGHDALKMAQGKLPDIIILDLVMPEIDGYEVCRRLKADPRSAQVPIIFLSGLISAQEKVKAFDAGGIDYIVKPCSTVELLARLHTHLTIQRTRNSLAEEVRNQTVELEKKNKDLQETNLVLKRLLHEIEEEKKEVSQIMQINIERFILPDLDRIAEAPIQQRYQLRDTIRTNLKDISSPVTGKNIDAYSLLTPTELRVLNLIRQGRSSKEIAQALNIAPQTVATHRKKIRKKLNISGKKVNLTAFITQE